MYFLQHSSVGIDSLIIEAELSRCDLRREDPSLTKSSQQFKRDSYWSSLLHCVRQTYKGLHKRDFWSPLFSGRSWSGFWGLSWFQRAITCKGANAVGWLRGLNGTVTVAPLSVTPTKRVEVQKTEYYRYWKWRRWGVNIADPDIGIEGRNCQHGDQDQTCSINDVYRNICRVETLD